MKGGKKIYKTFNLVGVITWQQQKDQENKQLMKTLCRGIYLSQKHKKRRKIGFLNLLTDGASFAGIFTLRIVLISGRHDTIKLTLPNIGIDFDPTANIL